jgi:3-isopropylmalate dehydrogenase
MNAINIDVPSAALSSKAHDPESPARVSIAVLPGDGIGPDIVESTVRVLDAAATKHGIALDFVPLPVGLQAIETHGSTLPEETLSALHRHKAGILGPVSHHIYPRDDSRYVNPSGYLRKHFDLYANIRPVVSLPGVKALQPDVDLVIVRENTEGFYADRNLLDGNGELRPNRDVVLSVRVVTRRASMRVADQAFRLARSRAGQRRVTAVHKANVLRLGDGLFLQCCRRVAKDFPDVQLDDLHVDAFAAALVQRPQQFDVIVTTNMFGDILSNEAASLVGGLGLAPGLNVGSKFAMAQAAHGSAPDIAHLRAANPVAEILSGTLLLRWLGDLHELPGLQQAAADIDFAIRETLRDGQVLTPDLAGTATTQAFTDAVLRRI